MAAEDDWADEVRRFADAVKGQGYFPESLRPLFDRVIVMWSSGVVDRELLMNSKLAFWEFLNKKHGNSISIVDAEDRAVRAALCVVELPSTAENLSDARDWVRNMLRGN